MRDKVGEEMGGESERQAEVRIGNKLGNRGADKSMGGIKHEY